MVGVSFSKLSHEAAIVQCAHLKKGYRDQSTIQTNRVRECNVTGHIRLSIWQ